MVAYGSIRINYGSVYFVGDDSSWPTRDHSRMKTFIAVDVVYGLKRLDKPVLAFGGWAGWAAGTAGGACESSTSSFAVSTYAFAHE